jgi:hypothetical protein
MALGELETVPASWTVKVIVRPACVLRHDGRTYGEGETLDLLLEDAYRLEEHGVVQRPD